jgi:hypothetical protein
MSLEEQLRSVADDIAEGTDLPPLETVQGRARRRRKRSLATAATTGVVLAGVIAAAVVAWPGSSPSHNAKVTPAVPMPSSPAPTSSGLDFTATVLPPGVTYVNTSHGPPNQFEEVIKYYRNASQTHTLIIDVNRGDVMTPSFYAAGGGFKLATVDGHPAAVGADNGRNAAGYTEAFVEISPTVTIDVEDRGGLSLAQVLDVLRGVQVR